MKFKEFFMDDHFLFHFYTRYDFYILFLSIEKLSGISVQKLILSFSTMLFVYFSILQKRSDRVFILYRISYILKLSHLKESFFYQAIGLSRVYFEIFRTAVVGMVNVIEADSTFTLPTLPRVTLPLNELGMLKHSIGFEVPVAT